MICEYCGNNIPPETSTCVSCGAPCKYQASTSSKAKSKNAVTDNSAPRTPFNPENDIAPLKFPVKETKEDDFLEDENNGFKSRTVYICLAIIFGLFGAHNFYAGHKIRAIIQLMSGFGSIVFLVPILPDIGYAVMSVVMIWEFVELFIIKKDAEGKSFAS